MVSSRSPLWSFGRASVVKEKHVLHLHILMRFLMKSGLVVSIDRLQEHEESLKEEYIEESKNLEEAGHEIREEAAHEIRELP